MKCGFIVEQFSDFEIGKYYIVISNDKIIDTFLCANYDSAAKHYLTYTERGCEIWKYLNCDEAEKIYKNLHDEESVYYQLFAIGKRSATANLLRCVELCELKNRLKTVFSKILER